MYVFDAVCPMGAKALQSGAPDMGVSRKKAVPPSALPIRGLCRRAGEGEALPALFCGGHGVSALPSAHERRKVHRPASPAAALFPCHPAGRPAGSARTRPRDQSLGDPFLGKRPPKTPQAAGPCAWACRRLCPHRPTRNEKEAPMPPARGAWARRIRANGAGRRHCRPAGLLSAGAFVDAAGYALHARVFGVFRLLVRGYG